MAETPAPLCLAPLRSPPMMLPICRIAPPGDESRVRPPLLGAPDARAVAKFAIPGQRRLRPNLGQLLWECSNTRGLSPCGDFASQRLTPLWQGFHHRHERRHATRELCGGHLYLVEPRAASPRREHGLRCGNSGNALLVMLSEGS